MAADIAMLTDNQANLKGVTHTFAHFIYSFSEICIEKSKKKYKRPKPAVYLDTRSIPNDTECGKESAYREWNDSCVSPEITQANVRWLDGEDAIEAVCGHALEQIDGHGRQYATGPVQRLLDRYEHLRESGLVRKRIRSA